MDKPEPLKSNQETAKRLLLVEKERTNCLVAVMIVESVRRVVEMQQPVGNTNASFLNCLLVSSTRENVRSGEKETESMGPVKVWSH